MTYLTNFEDCTVRQSDLNSLIYRLKQDVRDYRRMGEPAKAEAAERALEHVDHFVVTLRGMHACRQIAELCEVSARSIEPPPPSPTDRF